VTAPSRPADLASRLAGLVILVDGFLALLTAGMFLLISTIFRPVAAVEGRPPLEQSWLVEAAISLVIAAGGLWAGQRLVRGIPGAHLLGGAIAGLVAGLLAWLLVTGDAGSIESTIVWSGIAAVHGLAAIAALRSGSRPVGPPLEQATTAHSPR
jgi:hypothetical protein